MVAEILTDRYIKIVEENNMQFFRYKQCCNESALKEMESENDKNWKMGISPDQFIADTQDLTNEELGVYFRLLCYAWKKEAYLPTDFDRLQRIGQNCEIEIIEYLLVIEWVIILSFLSSSI